MGAITEEIVSVASEDGIRLCCGTKIGLSHESYCDVGCYTEPVSLKILEQEVADLKEFVHQLIDKLNVQELRRQRDERRQQGR